MPTNAVEAQEPVTRQRLFTKTQLADFLNVGVRQISYFMTKPEFPRAYRSGSHPRWAEDDIVAWLEAGRDPEISKQ
jgi:predicted DNA-binding transcriptional regulator AlpA